MFDFFFRSPNLGFYCLSNKMFALNKIPEAQYISREKRVFIANNSAELFYKL